MAAVPGSPDQLVRQLHANPKRWKSPASLRPRKNASFQGACHTVAACCRIPKIFTGMTELIRAKRTVMVGICVRQSRLGPLNLMIRAEDRAIRATPPQARLIPTNFNP